MAMSNQIINHQIWRTSIRPSPNLEMMMSRVREGLNTAFFSPLSGDKILSTWHTQKITVFNSSVLSAVAVEETLNVDSSKRLFSTYTPYAIWHPRCEDIFVNRCSKSVNEMAVYSTGYNLPVMKLATSDAYAVSRYAIHPQLDMTITMEANGRAILWRWRNFVIFICKVNTFWMSLLIFRCFENKCSCLITYLWTKIN